MPDFEISLFRNLMSYATYKIAIYYLLRIIYNTFLPMTRDDQILIHL